MKKTQAFNNRKETFIFCCSHIARNGHSVVNLCAHYEELSTRSNKKSHIPPSMETSTQNSPIILVVDDEEAIREAVRDILELVEIQSILAANGQEAIELFIQHRERIKAILLDLRMPVMSGTETYGKLRELDPAVRIILSSGYDEKMSTLDFDADDALMFLRKPYALDALLACVQDALI
jgi:CheY-like chemotaxis protein